jgi:broad specificity phosphatase PhoE
MHLTSIRGCPGGETPEEMTGRVDRVINKIVDIHKKYIDGLNDGSIKKNDHGGDVLIVSHVSLTYSSG